jgi:hypothetical protein
MSKLLATAASLKAILVVASFALARGDMLPVILISALFDLAPQSDAKPVRQTVRQDLNEGFAKKSGAAVDLDERKRSSVRWALFRRVRDAGTLHPAADARYVNKLGREGN